MNLYHHWYFVFIFAVASGQWLKCEAAASGKGQSKDAARKVNKRDYSDYGGIDYPVDYPADYPGEFPPDYPSYNPADNPSDKSDFEISYNFAGNIKFKLGSKKNKKPQSYFPYWLLNLWPTPEPALVACPSYIPSPICARPPGSCTSDSECYSEEVCCLTEEWIGYSCCVSTVEVTTVEDTSVSYPVSEPAALCPSYIPSPTCQRAGTCQIDMDCHFQETCCQINDWIGYSCCVSTAEVTSEPDPIYDLCPNVNPYLACQREEACSSYTDCFSNETCCQIQELIAVGEPSCCVLYSDIVSTTTEDITETTTETIWTTSEIVPTPDFSEIIPDMACPNRNDYNPDVCYHCSPSMPNANCYDTDACCFSSIKSRYCCYSNGTAPFTTTTTETPTTITTTPVQPTVFVKTCVIPPGVSFYYWPTNCVSSSECPATTECCNGLAGAGCYDWPTRVPEPGSSCPRGYKTCALQPGNAGGEGTPKTCSTDDYNTACSESEYCCRINNSTNACCVEKNTELVWPE